MADLLQYLAAAPSPYHAVAQALLRLTEAGFQRLRLAEPWALRSGHGYFVACDGALIAWRCGASWPHRCTTRWVAAHTDSPNLRLKPRPLNVTADGYCRLNVQVYGSPLWYTWLDRGLGLAGRVVYLERGKLKRRLVHIAEPVCHIPSLAIHLNQGVNQRGLVLNPEQHLRAMFATACSSSAGPTWEGCGAIPSGSGRPVTNRGVEALIAESAGVHVAQLRALDVGLVDTAPPTLVGRDREFVLASRLDNQAMCHAATRALVDATAAVDTCGVVLFDHEEIGSRTEHGAAGPLLGEVMARLAPTQLKREVLRATSLLVSADMGHGVHPNYPERHDDAHRPTLNAGPLLKINCNHRYATDDVGAAWLRELCSVLSIPLQEYVNRNDLACGSTLGPHVATRWGLRTVDVGSPLLAMHSIRETAGTRDHRWMCRLLKALFVHD